MSVEQRNSSLPSITYAPPSRAVHGPGKGNLYDVAFARFNLPKVSFVIASITVGIADITAGRNAIGQWISALNIVIRKRWRQRAQQQRGQPEGDNTLREHGCPSGGVLMNTTRRREHPTGALSNHNQDSSSGMKLVPSLPMEDPIPPC